jgi:hypothetical protein
MQFEHFKNPLVLGFGNSFGIFINIKFTVYEI